MLSTQGFVTEGTTNNFFIVKNGEVWTAPLSVGILAGITRDWIFEICLTKKIPIQERLFTAGDVQAADELFLSSSIKEVMGVTTLNGSPVKSGLPGPITRKIHEGFLEIVAEYVKNHKAESLYS